MSDGENFDTGPDNLPVSKALPDVIVDSREPEELYLAIAKALPGKIVIREAVSTDIIIPGEPSFAMERKEISDFINTWQGNRLYEQLETLKMFQAGGYQVGLLLVGNITKVLRYRKMKFNQLLNMIASVWAGWNISILPVEQEWAVPYLVKYLADKASGVKKDYKIAKAAPRDATPAEQAIYVLQSFPGIGSVTTNVVREQSSTLGGWLYDMIAHGEAPGLNEKQAEKVSNVLTAQWSKESK